MPKLSFAYICLMTNRNIERIGVFGCGWLGLPLAIQLEADGYHLHGTTTSKDKIAILAAKNIAPFLVQLNPDCSGDAIRLFLDVDLLIINIPPKRHQGLEHDYVEKMQNIALALKNSKVQKVIFISSTSVYPENQTLVTEETFVNSDSPSALSLFKAEEIFRNLENLQTTVIRMSGLIGPSRHPGRFFAGKENIPNGLAPVNLIHLDDCIGMIKWVISKEIWGETLNGTSPSHPTKADFYGLAAQQYNQTTAKFIAEKKEFKIVSSKKLIEQYSYQFKIPDLIEWLLQTPQS